MGVIYREIQQALTDMDRMFSLLETDQEIADSPTAKNLIINDQTLGPQVSFENVGFSYEPNRVILNDLSFDILPGQTTAVVGHSGVGKVRSPDCYSVFMMLVQAQLSLITKT